MHPQNIQQNRGRVLLELLVRQGVSFDQTTMKRPQGGFPRDFHLRETLQVVQQQQLKLPAGELRSQRLQHVIAKLPLGDDAVPAQFPRRPAGIGRFQIIAELG